MLIYDYVMLLNSELYLLMVIARNVYIKINLNESAGSSLTNVLFQLALEINFSCIMKKFR